MNLYREPKPKKKSNNEVLKKPQTTKNHYENDSNLTFFKAHLLK